MTGFITSLDPTERAFIVIVVAVAIKGLLASTYSRWKIAQKSKPVVLRLHNGIYEPDSTVERVERVFSAASLVWGAVVAALLVALIVQRYY